MQRRDFVKTGLAAGAAAALAPLPFHAEAAKAQAAPAAIKHSVSRWCYDSLSLEELARASQELGLQSVELLDPEEWSVVQEMGLSCAMVNAPGSIEEGFNDPQNHDRLVAAYKELIPQVAEAGLPNLICFSGNRDGMSDEEGLTHCAEGLEQILPDAEEHGVTICMELLNSKVDHPDYQCDHTSWGVALAERLGSERFKLLYDIYHMQIMEGDVIRTIRDNHEHIAHYHTGGVPGRNEINETQELFYPAIVRAIQETGYEGFLGQEFIPTREDPIASLREAIEICSV